MKKNKLLSVMIAIIFYGIITYFIVVMYPGRSNFDLIDLAGYTDIIINGWLTTILISLITLILSMFLGFGLYLLSKSKILALKYIASIFNEIVFGSPTIVFFLVIYFFIGVPLHFDNRFIVGVLAFSMYMAPYMKNVIDGAIESIDDLQLQAMKVFGFSSYQKYRYIILPQLFKMMIPPLISNLTFIVKGSALLNFIGVEELYNQISTAQSATYALVEGYLVMFLMYLMITIPLIRLTKIAERKVSSWN